MSEVFPFTGDPVGGLIFAAIEHANFQWRSLGGIAREANLKLETVQDYINEHRELFDQSPLSPGGIPLYTVQRRWRKAAA